MLLNMDLRLFFVFSDESAWSYDCSYSENVSYICSELEGGNYSCIMVFVFFLSSSSNWYKSFTFSLD